MEDSWNEYNYMKRESKRVLESIKIIEQNSQTFMFYSTFEGCVDSILQSNMNTIRVLLKCSLTCSWVHVVVVVVVVVLLISLVEVVPRVGLGPTRVHGGLCSSSIPATVILCLYISTQRVICTDLW